LLTGNIKQRAKLAAVDHQSKREMMHDMVEPSGSPGPRRQYVCVNPFVKNAAPAEDCTAAETPRKKHETNPAARNWQIRKTPRISTVDPPGYYSARRA
jgi:hypothetical protein